MANNTIFNIANLTVSNEEELQQAMKRRLKEQRVITVVISKDQEKWFSKLSTVYDHHINGKIRKEYYSPWGEHEVEVFNETQE